MSKAHESLDNTTGEKEKVASLRVIRGLGDKATPLATPAPTWWGPEQSARRRGMLSDTTPFDQVPEDN